MTYDEYKKHLEACGSLDDISKGLLSAFELGYGQGIKDGKTHFTKALAEPEQEPVAWHEPGAYGNVTTHKDWALANGWEPLYTAPPKRERVVFPTMLRKMWSGGEVQAWLDENVNKEKNS